MNSTVISECGLYRYKLQREFFQTPEKPGTVVWVLCNPSTADASKDDPTVRKCRGFTREWGYGKFLIVNAYAFRATNPKRMLSAQDPFGPYNLNHLREAFVEARAAGMLVFGWGGALPKPLRIGGLRIRALAEECGVKPWCLGTTIERQPRHPLMLGYSTPLCALALV